MYPEMITLQTARDFPPDLLRKWNLILYASDTHTVENNPTSFINAHSSAPKAFNSLLVSSPLQSYEVTLPIIELEIACALVIVGDHVYAVNRSMKPDTI